MHRLVRTEFMPDPGFCAYPQDDELRRAAQLDSAGKCDEAERIYDEALSKRALSASLLNNIGNHYLVCAQPDKARTYFERVLSLNPEHANANLQLARLATEQKQGKQAHAIPLTYSGFESSHPSSASRSFVLCG